MWPAQVLVKFLTASWLFNDAEPGIVQIARVSTNGKVSTDTAQAEHEFGNEKGQFRFSGTTLSHSISIDIVLSLPLATQRCQAL